MNKIKYIVIHCTGTNKFATIDAIENYWKNNLKWKSKGYHFIIDRNGNICKLTKLTEIANGVKGYNLESIHISYIGGISMEGKNTDTRTDEQKEALKKIILQMRALFPYAIIQGHRDFPNVAKDCPCFDAKKEYKNY